MELTKDDAANIVRALDCEGGRLIQSWIDERLSTLSSRILAGQGEVSVESITTEKDKRGSKKIEITVLNVIKDADRSEARALNLLKSKFADWQKMALPEA